ncbi:MAG: dihydrolipoyl dehydrogenase [Deltaproteobacteria bacterium]|nr:dihydrolipoyl dehydrogenase [Deltaproteobacteria bacterium]
MSNDKKRVLVIGGGPGGYPAAFLAADLGCEVTLVDQKVNPGGVCLFQGCIPSKALLHVARLLHETREAGALGLGFAPPTIDLDKLRAWKDGVVGKLTGGLGLVGKQRKVRFVEGRARLLDAHSAMVAKAGDGAGEERIEFDDAILATGSMPVTLPFLPPSPRIWDSTKALELAEVPGSLLVVGGGYIGLELGTVYAALGSKVTVVEATPYLLPGADRDLVTHLQKRLAKQLAAIHVSTKIVEAREDGDGVRVKLVGIDLPELEPRFDRVLVAVGRRPLSKDLGLENTKVKLDARGFVDVDAQRRTAEPSIYAIGDMAGEPMLAHKATYEGRIAAQAIAGHPAAYEPRAIPAVVFTDPEIAWAGLTESQAKTEGRDVRIARFPWSASGRATTMGRNDGLTKLVIDPQDERLLGVGIVGVGAGEMIAEGVLALEMGARATDMMLTIHAHPTLSETMMEAAEVYFGHSPHLGQKPAR